MDLLSGIRVVSLNHFLAGPTAAQILGDLGADVIAVEPIEGAFQRNWAIANHFVGTQSVNLLATARNKRSLSLDLKSVEGVQVAKRVLSKADVLMENFRPGVLSRIGLDYDTLRNDTPGLVYASLTGFGSFGPMRDRPGQDLLLQALSGLAARTGRADGAPTPVGPTIVDQHAATICASAILAALVARQRTGRGQRVEVSLYQAALDLQVESLTAWFNGARAPSPRGPAGIASWFSPGPYGIHKTKDGFLAVSMASPVLLARALELSELESFTERDSFSQREKITDLVARRLAERSTSEWIKRLEKCKVWHAPVQDYPELRDDPQLATLDVFANVTGAEGFPITLIMHPARYDGEGPKIRLVPQLLGAQTREIMAEAGYTQEQIEDFGRRRIVTWPK